MLFRNVKSAMRIPYIDFINRLMRFHYSVDDYNCCDAFDMTNDMYAPDYCSPYTEREKKH